MQEPKYTFDKGRVINRASGDAIPLDEPVMVFRARDHNAVAMIEFYQSCCSDPQHREAVQRRIEDFERFRADHPERMKEPDTERYW
jgi:hypothetical protein